VCSAAVQYIRIQIQSDLYEEQKSLHSSALFKLSAVRVCMEGSCSRTFPDPFRVAILNRINQSRASPENISLPG
jgi:hypothetical protein